jgi:hypothetical protein
MAGGRSERGSRRTPRAASVVVPFPRGAAGDRLNVVRFVPSGRSLLVGAIVGVAGVAAYWLAVSTSLFAVQRVEVDGAPPAVERQVRAVASYTLGHSLVSLDAGEIATRVRALPTVAGVSVDRAFPHALVIRVAPERAAAVARRRDRAWLVTGSGKVLRSVDVRFDPTLPRVWLPKTVPVAVDVRLPTAYAQATRALAAAQEVGLGSAVKGARFDAGELKVALRSGVELRLGAPLDLALKLAIGRRVVRSAGPDVAYVDLSVPSRPVAG